MFGRDLDDSRASSREAASDELSDRSAGQDSSVEEMIDRAVHEFIVPSLLLRHTAGRIALINEATRRNAELDESSQVTNTPSRRTLQSSNENSMDHETTAEIQEADRSSSGTIAAISKSDIVDSAMAALQCVCETFGKRWASLRADGHAAEDLYLRYLSPVAVELGRRWLDDESSFGDVTMAMTVLHRQLHEAYSELEAEVETHQGRRSILLAPAPGTDHVFGAAMVELFFRAYGWSVTSGVGLSEAELLAKVAGQKFDVVGLSLGSHDSNKNYADLVGRIRQASPNDALVVMAGGAPFIEEPELAERLGADATAPDARRAVLWARRLVTHKTVK